MKNCSVYYINSSAEYAANVLGRQLSLLFSQYPPGMLPPVILCIGTDRVTGDSLGPLTGTFLQSFGVAGITVYGTLQAPVHALNLKDACRSIKKKHPGRLILAIDASLGSKKNIGYITVGQGSLQPGAGVQKQLTSVGDVFITGIINTEAPAPQVALQNTRLSCVIPLSSCIARGVLYACSHPDAGCSSWLSAAALMSAGSIVR